jgi:sugar O-acyltransferase (sialic acid O-acetyltransferase NeuD family)
MERIEVVFFGCGAMAIEAASYLHDVNMAYMSTGEMFVVSDIVARSHDRYDELCDVISALPVIHTDVASVTDRSRKKFSITIGTTMAKIPIYEKLASKGFELLSIIHPRAWVSPLARIGKGVTVAPHVFVGPFANIGDNTLLSVGSTVGHDAVLGHSTVVSPHVCLNGGARCGRGVFFGSGAIVDPKVEIGDFSRISSGSVVRKAVAPGSFVFGNPAVQRRLFNPNTGKAVFDAVGDSSSMRASA